MVFSSQEETQDSNIPSSTSTRTSITGNVQYRRSSKEVIQSHQGSISNFSVHTTSTAATRKDLFDCSEGGDPSISHLKYSHSLEKPTSRFTNQSQSTVGTIGEARSVLISTATSTSRQETRLLNIPPFEDADESPLHSTPRSSAYSLFTDRSPSLTSIYGATPSIPLDDLLTNPYGDFHPSATMEISKADKAPIRPASFLPARPDRLGTTSRSRSRTATIKGKKGVLGFMSGFLNPNKRPEISTPYDLVHLTHVEFNPSTREFTGLPQEWEQLLQDSGISKSDQEMNPRTVMEVVKFYQEGGGDIWDKMGHVAAPGGSRRPSIPGAANAPYFEAPAPINAAMRESLNSNTDVGLRSQASKASNGPVVEPQDHQLRTTPQHQRTAATSSAKTAGATPRRREKKKGKANDDIVTRLQRLQQICTDADPTRLYRNLAKIGQG
jgi:p21-activated kinase 1